MLVGLLTRMKRKKRKGSGNDDDDDYKELDEAKGLENCIGIGIRSHFSLEDRPRLRKKCKEEVGCDNGGLCGSRIVGFTTVPPCGGSSSSMVEPTRGLKRKIGCIDVSTQMGRKNKFDDDYVLCKTLGRGRFGSVWLCKCRVSGEQFACKTLRKGEETVHREVEIMQHLSGHPGIVMLKAVYEDSECFHLVMELCSGGRLVDQMAEEGRYSEQRAACITKELMLVIKYCHEMGVVHRDIKPENVLLTSSGKMKLADFGLAMRIANGQSLSGIAGSPAYVAPEVLWGNYREKVDVWSAGILLHALLAGVLPFQGSSLEAVFDAIKSVKLDFQSGPWESVSEPARDLVEKMLTRDVSSRITVDEVLAHPWILFYTERTLKSLSLNLKRKDGSTALSHQVSGTSTQSDRPSANSSPFSTPSRAQATSDSEKHDDSGLVDALAVAISQVRISEPKRSRLCSPSDHPIQQQYSANSLCEAF